MALSGRQTRWFTLGTLPLVLGCAGAAGSSPGATGGAGASSSPAEPSAGGAPVTPTIAKATAPCAPDETAPVPDHGLLTGLWQKVELPGTVCGNGSQYKFFVNYARASNNLIVSLEGGGACW